MQSAQLDGAIGLSKSIMGREALPWTGVWKQTSSSSSIESAQLKGADGVSKSMKRSEGVEAARRGAEAWIADENMVEDIVNVIGVGEMV